MSDRHYTDTLEWCHKTIKLLMVVIAFFGSGFAAVVGYNDFLVIAFGEIVVNTIIAVIFLAIFLLSAFLILRFIKIQQINIGGKK